MVDKAKGGRPREGDQVKSSPLSMRIDPTLRQRLDEAREGTPRSLTQEVERRLRLSFESDALTLPMDMRQRLAELAGYRGHTVEDEVRERVAHSFLVDSFFGSSETSRLLRAIGSAIDGVEGRTLNTWSTDLVTFEAAVMAVFRLFMANSPAKHADNVAVAQAREEMFVLRDRSSHLINELEITEIKYPALLAWIDNPEVSLAPTGGKPDSVPTDVYIEYVRTCAVQRQVGKDLADAVARLNFLDRHFLDARLSGHAHADAVVPETLETYRITPQQRAWDELVLESGWSAAEAPSQSAAELDEEEAGHVG